MSELQQALSYALNAKARNATVYFVGNGGSAAICSHMAVDWLKNGGFKALCFNDPAHLTCIANDLGYDQVFSVPIERFGKSGDLLFALSSSGRSLSILNAVDAARKCRMSVVTLSGFDPTNPLREIGDVNYYVPSKSYGTVEIAHLTFLHGLLDMSMSGVWQDAIE